MSNIFVDSSKTGGSANGTDRDNAYLVLATALAAASAGDYIWVDKDHQDTNGNLFAPTGDGVISIIVADLSLGSGSTAPTPAQYHNNNSSSHINIDVTLTEIRSSNNITLYFKGLSTSMTSTGGMRMNNVNTSNAYTGGIIWEDGYIRLTSTGNIQFGNVSGGAYPIHMKVRNTVVDIALTSGQWFDKEGAAIVELDGVVLDFTQNSGVVPSGSIVAGDEGDGPSSITLRNCDWSNGNDWTGRAIFGLSESISYVAQNCQFSDDALILDSSAVISSGICVEAIGCKGTTLFAGSNNKNRMWRNTRTGIIQTEVTVFRTGGATDGTNTFSIDMTSTAYAHFNNGLPLNIPVYFDSTGSKTFRIELIHDNGSNLDDEDISLRVEYPDSTTSPALASAVHKADGLDDGTALSTSSATWSDLTSKMASPIKQYLTTTFTVNAVGVGLVTVELHKPSFTVYVCPEVVIS